MVFIKLASCIIHEIIEIFEQNGRSEKKVIQKRSSFQIKHILELVGMLMNKIIVFSARKIHK